MTRVVGLEAAVEWAHLEHRANRTTAIPGNRASPPNDPSCGEGDRADAPDTASAATGPAAVLSAPQPVPVPVRRSLLIAALAGSSSIPRRPRPRSVRVARIVALLAVAVLSLTACATTGGAQPDTGPTDGDKTVTIATSYSIDDLDPLVNGYWGPEFGYVELLMRPERNGQPSPWVLSALEPVDDLTWRLTLNEGVRFGSGRALDGAALAQLLTWTAQNNATFGATASFASAEATGPLEVLLRTSEPSPTMPNLLADESNVLVLDVDAYEAYKASGAQPAALLEAGIYTGPYRVQSLDTQAAQLVPVADHWAGPPALDRVTVRFVPEAPARVQAVQAGEVDIALYMAASTARTLEGRDDAFYLTGEPSGLVYGLISRVASPVMQDERVRRAIYSAIDYRTLAEDVLQGQAGVATGLFPSTYPYAVDTQVTDPTLAGQLLDEAGWVPGADGVRAKDGQPLTVRLICSTALPDYVTISEAVQSQLRPVGIDVQVVQVDDLTVARDTPDWDVSLSSSLLSFGGSPDQGITDLLSTGGDLDYAGISDPELDALAAELRRTLDSDRRTALLVQIQQLVTARGYYAVATQRVPTLVVGPEWKGYQPPVSNLWVDVTTTPSA